MMIEQLITNLIVHVRPEKSNELVTAISAIDGVHVPSDKSGELTVLIQSHNREHLMAVFNQIRNMRHVLATLFEFHQTNSNEILLNKLW